jgi:hypothetical protein
VKSGQAIRGFGNLPLVVTTAKLVPAKAASRGPEHYDTTGFRLSPEWVLFAEFQEKFKALDQSLVFYLLFRRASITIFFWFFENRDSRSAGS